MKTNKEIFPILKTSCPTIGWKLNKSASAAKNMEQLINKVEKLEKNIKDTKLPIEEIKLLRKKLKQAMTELGQTLTSIHALKKAVKSQNCERLVKSFEEKKTISLWYELIANLKISDKVRKESVNFQEAWKEIEANHFTKISLYNIEIERRNLK